jgi:hypothetical protein
LISGNSKEIGGRAASIFQYEGMQSATIFQKKRGKSSFLQARIESIVRMFVDKDEDFCCKIA